MDNQHNFIRGCVEIPIIGTDQEFIWGVWVTLSAANYKKVKEHWNQPQLLEPMPGWFSTTLPCYPDTLNLKAKVHHRANGIRPYVELEPTDHPLAVELRDGMTIQRVQQIAVELCKNNQRN